MSELGLNPNRRWLVVAFDVTDFASEAEVDHLAMEAEVQGERSRLPRGAVPRLRRKRLSRSSA